MEIGKTRKFLKSRLQQDTTTFYGFENEREHIKNLFLRAKDGESNSALLIGPKKCGKTTLVNSVLLEMLQDKKFVEKTLLILLNGLIHTDDRLALKSTTIQMNLEKEVEGKTFSSFSENLTFLLSCLKSGKDTQRLIFIIEEFDLFCAHHNQTLLYNLFDVAQSAQTPICVLGITHRLDVIELLEKRVKSRFSHRQIFLLPNSDDFETYFKIFKELLKLPTTQENNEYIKNNLSIPKNVFREIKLPFLRRLFNPSEYMFSKKHITDWNKAIDQLAKKEKVISTLENLFNTSVTIATLKLFLFQVVSNLNETHQKIEDNEMVKLIENLLFEDNKVKLLTGLSVLELCILIAIKHHCEIYDNDPFNFEIILTRYNKFALKSSTMQNIDREVILKAFENLKYQEFIGSIGIEGKIQKEYQMHKLLIFPDQIEKAIQRYQNLPTEVDHWSKSSIF
ncbi:hypothetical protein PVAND_007062 [Polypedilum vanderplanki]|uniref:Origin recognition complex subunit 4 n=1 Tax=Polypedilum vanderplanki TaxID=319348 RepID=A0A9J6C5V8_POLVA|nr:hypothetical protein PVAND_007062 [Polypedilum vanderplanki]